MKARVKVGYFTHAQIGIVARKYFMTVNNYIIVGDQEAAEAQNKTTLFEAEVDVEKLEKLVEKIKGDF